MYYCKWSLWQQSANIVHYAFQNNNLVTYKRIVIAIGKEHLCNTLHELHDEDGDPYPDNHPNGPDYHPEKDEMIFPSKPSPSPAANIKFTV